MYELELSFHGLTIHLHTPDKVLFDQWAFLLAGWVTPVQASCTTADVCFHLSLTDRLAIPEQKPVFVDMHTLPDEIGVLSVYATENGRLCLHFRQAGIVHLSTHNPSQTIIGQITQLATKYGRLEDITFTSLAPFLRRHGFYLLHAFAAACNGCAVLVVGPSGSGKTTSGLALLQAGWELLANDIVLLHKRPEGYLALPTPGGVSIRPPTLELLPSLRDLVSDTPLVQGKYHLTGWQVGNGRYASPAPVTHLYLPHITNQPQTNRKPLSRAIALAHLMEESIDRWDTAMLTHHITFLEQLCRQAQPYTLNLGRDVAQWYILAEKEK
ncbi:MAG: hypothetical protein D6706_21060 [Chloroflexi bacterium]|nr:MAG: hypothetical protein D6706_21060 [Chloroflexota bacterium]